MLVHYATDEYDDTTTACQLPVGYILAETVDEITLTPEDATCKDCLEALKEERED